MNNFKIHVAFYHDNEGDFHTFCGLSAVDASDHFMDEAKIVDKGDYNEATCKTCHKAADAYFRRVVKQIEKIEAEYANLHP